MRPWKKLRHEAKVLMRFWHTDICKLPPCPGMSTIYDAMERFQSKPSVSGESFKGKVQRGLKNKKLQPIKMTGGFIIMWAMKVKT